MAPNPRVVGAFRAMKAIGISDEKVKPVLKNLLKLYNKNWDLIEEENYRVLADAIFDSEEAKEAECKKSSENPEQEALMQDEPESPLKRQRLKQPLSQPNGSVESHLQNQSLDSPQAMGTESQHGSCSSLGRNKGKQPISSNSLPHGRPLSSQPSSMDKSLPRRAESNSVSGTPLSARKKSIAHRTLIKPKDEPITDDHLDAPVTITGSGSSSKGDSGTVPTIVESDTHDGIPPCPEVANGKPETNTVKSPSRMEIASSQSGEVKIILNYGSVMGRSDFQMPTLDAVMKLMENKCLKEFKENDPNFSVMKVMADVCQCFWEMGTEATNKSSAK